MKYHTRDPLKSIKYNTRDSMIHEISLRHQNSKLVVLKRSASEAVACKCVLYMICLYLYIYIYIYIGSM